MEVRFLSPINDKLHAMYEQSLASRQIGSPRSHIRGGAADVFVYLVATDAYGGESKSEHISGPKRQKPLSDAMFRRNAFDFFRNFS